MLRVSFIAAGAVLFSFSAVGAQTPRYPDVLPVSQLKPGMKGYGLTVFRGTKIEKFDVTVVGVVKKGSLLVPGHDMILVKMKGGPMTDRQANLIRGMSGSPVYINGKVIGAFSMGEPTTKEPLGGVTPIEDMLEAWDPKLPTEPLALKLSDGIRIAKLGSPIVTGGRRIEKVVYNVPPSSGLRSRGTTLVMHPCTTFMTVSTMSKTALARLQKALEPYNVEVLAGGQTIGNKPGFKGAPLLPGAAFSMMLAIGDLQSGATGTVSYRRGNRILGFGHPFLGIGPIDAPLTSAWIYDVYPLLAGSYKISSPGPVVGASTQDRNFSVSGEIGRIAKTIPVTVSVSDMTTGRSKVFQVRTISHPNLYSSMVSSVVSAAVAEIRSIPGAAMGTVVTTVDAEEIGKITRRNVVFDRRSIDAVATADLDDLLSIFTSNPFYPVGIKGASVKVEIKSGYNTAQVERIFLKEGRYEPGETVDLGVVLKPYKKPSVIRTVKLTVPANLPSGRYPIQVRGGAVPAPLNFGGFIIRSASPQNPDQAPPVSIRQMVNRYNEREKNNELVVRMVLPTTAVNVEGEKLTNLPPSLDALLRTSKSSGVRLERDEVKAVVPTDWVVAGSQLVNINVQRKDTRETTPGGQPPGGSGSFQPTGSGTGSFSQVTVIGEDEEQESAPIPLGEGFSVPDSSLISGRQAPAAGPPSNPPIQGAQPQSPAATVQTPPAAPDAFTTEKPVARIAAVWRQMTRTDFANGTARGVSVTTAGDLRLARSLQKLYNTTEGFLWSLIPDGAGRLIAGTGSQGRVLRIGPNRTIAIIAQLPEIAIHSLVRSADGAIYAATSPNGRTYRISADGKFQVAHQAKEKYALALAMDSKGNVFVGTGGGGTIYRIPPTGSPSVFFRTPAQHVQALTIDKSDNLYAGTATDGLVYKITPEGDGSVLYDAPEQSITAIAVSSNGSVYATTAPKGVVYKVDPDGGARMLFDKAPTAFTAITAADNDTLYASAGSVIYVISNDRVAPLENQLDVDILSLSVGQDGTLYAGTGNVAEVYAALPVGQQQTGTFDSVVHDAKQRSRWGSVRWTASTPSGTSVVIQTRSGNVAEPDATWSDWTALGPDSEGGRSVSPAARYIQYRVQLTSAQPGVTPALRDIAITYLPKNQAPTVTFQAPAGGERWARNQTVRWQAVDPEKDTLNYQLFYSRDNGATWTPVPGGTASSAGTSGVAPPPAAAAPPPAAAPARRQPPQSVAEVTAVLDSASPPVPAELRAAILAQARALNDEWAQQAGASPTGAPPAAEPAVPSRETNKPLDTRNLSDGAYVLKVVATDRPSNAVDPQTAEAVSEAFVVCNTAPVVTVLRNPSVAANGVVTMTGSAVQSLIPITAVQFRVGTGEWLAAAPSDGIFDGRLENFSITTSPLPKGTHTIEVKAFNAANLIATDKVTVEVN